MLPPPPARPACWRSTTPPRSNPAARTASTYRTEPGYVSTSPFSSFSSTSAFLALLSPSMVAAPGGSSGLPRAGGRRGLEEAAGAAVAGAAVDVAVVVELVEGDELGALLGGHLAEVRVERLLPRGEVDGGAGQHAVEVEQACRDLEAVRARGSLHRKWPRPYPVTQPRCPPGRGERSAQVPSAAVAGWSEVAGPVLFDDRGAEVVRLVLVVEGEAGALVEAAGVGQDVAGEEGDAVVAGRRGEAGTRRRASMPRPRAEGSTSSSRRRAVSSSSRVQATNPARRPSTSATQARSRAGS